MNKRVSYASSGECDGAATAVWSEEQNKIVIATYGPADRAGVPTVQTHTLTGDPAALAAIWQGWRKPIDMTLLRAALEAMGEQP